MDDVALAPSVQAVEGAIQADEPGERAALEKLHAILTPAQRVELVTKIASRGAEAKARWTHHDGGAPKGERGPGMLARELNLSAAQMDRSR